ncbi:hypothetical protein [Enhydrobacter sp.]|jgi:hypothetical protein|uniref:hypothetical protein n=1 Tax=Enhydrobacter sp. TaxID=1894999 RepID=UPI002631AB4B|nr:hypothetical protein [Enhydrobacter sp.]WIM14097.1 MAG: hypothetical protein OJF58_005067 [Enhydrobacter sp.]
MKAVWTAVIYFGSFLALGLAAKVALGRWTKRHDVDLAGIQAQAGPNRRQRRLFLLGAWRTED